MKVLATGGLGLESEGINEIGDFSKVMKVVTVNSRYFRPSKVPFLKCDSIKIHNTLGGKTNYYPKALIEEMFLGEFYDSNI